MGLQGCSQQNNNTRWSRQSLLANLFPERAPGTVWSGIYHHSVP